MGEVEKGAVLYVSQAEIDQAEIDWRAGKTPKGWCDIGPVKNGVVVPWTREETAQQIKAFSKLTH
ncbi:hypothetical protein HOE67_03660 [Candidatus Peregrinibacteria bacterium]|jgi:hypothetical protein|nr:hypothetical protein [Candidatus Peregrinibacteria bacterium]MBT4056182.1 hypothetical protein [Candidatus Peregrinibacteria bacterium]